MIDHNVVCTEKWIADEESANEDLCRQTAIDNGHTWQEADTCEAGELTCKTCPWRDGDK